MWEKSASVVLVKPPKFLIHHRKKRKNTWLVGAVFFLVLKKSRMELDLFRDHAIPLDTTL